MHPGPGKHEFLLGDALLVGVMSDPEPRRQITLPEGRWLDYWDNHVEHRGGQTIDVEVPEDRNPIYVRVGAIIPLDVSNDAVRHGTAASKGWRTLDIYPASEPSQATIWDTQEFPFRADRDRTFVTVTPGKDETEIRLAGGPTRDTIWRIWRATAPSTVAADGKQLDQQTSATDWEKSVAGWWFDADDQRLWIRAKAVRDVRVKITN